MLHLQDFSVQEGRPLLFSMKMFRGMLILVIINVKSQVLVSVEMVTVSDLEIKES